MVKLTDIDVGTLVRALFLADRYDAGIYGNYKHLEKLSSYGLLNFDDYLEGGYDIDGNETGSRRLYRLTQQGKKVAKKLDNLGDVSCFGFEAQP